MRRAITLLGWALIAASPLPWGGIISLPFLGLSFERASLIGVTLLLTSEGLFLAGAALVAPDLLKNRAALVDRVRAWLRGSDERR